MKNLKSTLALSNAVKVDMQGSLSLGKDVMDTLNYYLRNGYGLSGRRSMHDSSDPIAIEVRSTGLCRKLTYCRGPYRKFINEFVTSLSRSIEHIFDENMSFPIAKKLETAKPIFEKLDGVLKEAKKILKAADDKTFDENDPYMWTTIVKRLSGKFLSRAVIYVSDKLGPTNQFDHVKKDLTQKIVLAVVQNEAVYQKSLCTDHNICLQTAHCTKALNDILEQLIAQSNIKIKAFLKSFQDALQAANFYTHLNEDTAIEFQVIMNDMAFTDNVPTRDILSTLKKTVADRLDSGMSKSTDENPTPGFDVLLLHRILSDMDLLYSKGKKDPFYEFLNGYSGWTASGGRIAAHMKNIFKNLRDFLEGASEEQINKLTFEVRVFLELTVDPDTNKNKR